MPFKKKIAILGLGGVGGFIGGALASRYSSSKEIEVIFIVREINKEIISKNGLRLISDEGEKIIFPHIITDAAGVKETLDYIIVATKGYDLEESLNPLSRYITPQTVILPLLNGVDASGRILKIFPGSRIWKGCIYIVSRRVAPGVVKKTGYDHKIYFGHPKEELPAMNYLEKIMMEAGLNVTIPDNIEQVIWEKFLFISPLATVTTTLDMPISAVLDDPEKRTLLMNAILEVKHISDKMRIGFNNQILNRIWTKMEQLMPGTYSSMHSDFRNGGKTELESITGYVIELGRELQIPTPFYKEMYNQLLHRKQSLKMP